MDAKITKPAINVIQDTANRAAGTKAAIQDLYDADYRVRKGIMEYKKLQESSKTSRTKTENIDVKDLNNAEAVVIKRKNDEMEGHEL